MPEGLTLTGYSRSQGRFPTRETCPPRHDPSRTWVSLLLSPLEARERTERNRKEGEGRAGKEREGREGKEREGKEREGKERKRHVRPTKYLPTRGTRPDRYSPRLSFLLSFFLSFFLGIVVYLRGSRWFQECLLLLY